MIAIRRCTRCGLRYDAYTEVDKGTLCPVCAGPEPFYGEVVGDVLYDSRDDDSPGKIVRKRGKNRDPSHHRNGVSNFRLPTGREKSDVFPDGSRGAARGAASYNTNRPRKTQGTYIIDSSDKAADPLSKSEVIQQSPQSLDRPLVFDADDYLFGTKKM